MEKKCSTADRAESKLRLFTFGFDGNDDAPILFDLKKDFNDVINLGKAGKTERMHNLLIDTKDILSDSHDAINHQAAWPRGYKTTPLVQYNTTFTFHNKPYVHSHNSLTIITHTSRKPER